MDLEWERENPRDNVIAGTVGAFLGSLIGVACIVIFSKLGYVIKTADRKAFQIWHSGEAGQGNRRIKGIGYPQGQIR